MFQKVRPPHDASLKPQAGQPKEITRLQETIRRAHGCASRYCRTAHVVVAGSNNNAWDGFVMTFDLIDSSPAKFCYAWKDGAEFVLVVDSPSVSSPETAVAEWSAARSE